MQMGVLYVKKCCLLSSIHTPLFQQQTKLRVALRALLLYTETAASVNVTDIFRCAISRLSDYPYYRRSGLLLVL